jgi:hypothetical protein
MNDIKFTSGEIVYYVDRTNRTYKIHKTVIEFVKSETYGSAGTVEKIIFNSFPYSICSDAHGVPQTVDNRPPELFHTLEEAIEGAPVIKNYWDKRR